MSDLLFTDLLEKLKSYKKKYYLNSLLKGLIFFFTLTASAFLLVTFLEYYGKFNSQLRLSLFFGYITLFIAGIYKWVAQPLAGLFALTKNISDEYAAKEIGKHFPEVQDKLLNTLQLKKITQKDNLFIQASIAQKTNALSVIPFSKAIDLGENKRYLRYLLLPSLLILLVLIFVPQIFVESTARIIHYDKTFEYPSPFKFEIKNKDLSAFKNEDFTLKIELAGKAIPDDAFIYVNGRKTKMKQTGAGNYEYNFKNLQKTQAFHLEAAGFASDNYALSVVARPDLKALTIHLNYPAYLKKQKETVLNAGNLTIPEGTSVEWNFGTKDVKKLNLHFSDEKKERMLTSSSNNFIFSRRIKKPLNYTLELENDSAKGKEKINFHINVIPDQFPVINIDQIKDTSLYSTITFAGIASDDYGLRKLKLYYRKASKESKEKAYTSLPIEIKGGTLSQNFLYTWSLDSLIMHPGEKLEYYLEVWDNDAVNGSKSTKSTLYQMAIPSREEIRESINSSSSAAKSSIEELSSRSKTLKEELKKIEDRLKIKKDLDWQDKKALEEVLEKHKALKNDIQALQENYNELNEKLQKYNTPQPELLQKMAELQQLMNELLDEETKKLYNELEKMLQEKANKEDLQKLLEKLGEKGQNMEKELDRSLEWFKQIQFEQKAEQAQKDLEKLSEEQKEQAEKTQQKEASNEARSEEQKKLNEAFKDVEKQLEELKKLNEGLENKKQMENFGEEKEAIKQSQQESLEQLQKNHNKKASDAQQKAGEKMEDMAAQLKKMQSQRGQQELGENMKDLRAILENLIKLSFDQEDLMKEFKKVNQSDPRYIELSQKQYKLKDDSKVIEDSLNALAKRVFQIQSYVTRELGKINSNMEDGLKNIENRRPNLAASNQQFSMTSMNNLALLLNDALKQMQQQMAQKKGGSQMCQKPGSSSKPGLGELQKQLNEQLRQLKKGNKSGESLSKEIAQMVAKQEMIRNALKELEGKPGSEKAGKTLSELQKEMEQTEQDLVNKRISQELINRQQEILTRLLEAENALKERGLDNKRESKSGKAIKRDMPPSLEKYLKEKEKQVELLKTINPSYTPYYKKEVNEYFQKIEK